ncbi:MAG: permease [Paracoccus sp. (in: a-proteobacteria)]|uniref:permease n=1 Tax=Paracoccus sp. TaxID=267 RepID=UPI0039E32E21
MLGEMGKRPGRKIRGRFFHVSLVRTGTRGAGRYGMTVNFDPGREPSEGPIMPGADAAPGINVLDIAEGLFLSYAADLDLLRRKIEAGATEEVKESCKLVRTLRDAAHLVLEERNKVDKLRKDAAGQVGAGALDLVAARDEVGRRLACLRRAGGG